MTYYVCDTSALLYKYQQIFDICELNDTIIICAHTFEENTPETNFVISRLEYNNLEYNFYKFEDYMLKRLVYNHGDKDVRCLAAALDYDCTQHPDETIFITDNEEMADIANLYFGEDSIICLSPCPN